MSYGKKLFAGLAVVALGTAAYLGLNEFQDQSERKFGPAEVVESEVAEGPRRNLGDSKLEMDQPEPETLEAEARAAELSAQNAGKRVHIQGRLTDAEGHPIAGVQAQLVEILGKKARSIGAPYGTKPRGTVESLADGRFSLDLALIPETYEIRLKSDQYVDQTLEVEVNEALHYDLGEIRLERGASITGVVRHQGRPVPGVAIKAHDLSIESASPLAIAFQNNLQADEPDAVSDAEGRFRVSGLKASEWRLSTEHEEFLPGESPMIKLVAGQGHEGVQIALESGARLTGIVKDQNDRAIEGAEVTLSEAFNLLDGINSRSLSSRKTTTNKEGRFEFAGLTPKGKTLRVTRTGFRDQRVGNCEPSDADVLVFMAPAAKVYGQVRSQETGATIAEARVQVARERFFNPRKEKATVLLGEKALSLCNLEDPRGLFVAPAIATNQIRLEAEAPGYGTIVSPSLSLEELNERRYDFSLPLEATIEGQVLDPSGRPVAGATVKFSEPNSGARSFDGDFALPGRRSSENKEATAKVPDEVTTDKNGQFLVQQVAAQKLKVTAELEGFSPSLQQELEVESGARSQVALQLRAATSIVGQVLDSQGKPQPKRGVQLSQNTGENVFRMSGATPQFEQSDEEGRFAFKNLKPGDYRVELQPEGRGLVMLSFDDGEEVHEDVSLGEGETREILLQDLPKVRVFGSVRAAGQPVVDATVKISSPGAFAGLGGKTTKTDSQGRFEVTNLKAGDYKVSVTAPQAAIATKLKIHVTAQDKALTIDLPVGAIEGRVVNARNGKGVPGLKLTATAQKAETEEDDDESSGGFMISIDGGDGVNDISAILGSSPSVLTEADGRYRISYLPDGDYVLKVSGGSYEEASSEVVVVHEGKVVPGVDFVLEPGASIIVKLKSRRHRFFNIKIKRIDGEETFEQSQMSRVGTTTFPGLKPGLYSVKAETLGQEMDQESTNKGEEVLLGDQGATVEIDMN